MVSVDLATGSIFAGRYRIVGRLASGGMGAVYEVVHLETRRRRALKVMLPELFSKPELRDRFRREAHVTASVKSEFLVDVFDAGLDEASGTPFLVMELLEGEDLGRLVERTGPLPPTDVVSYLAQVASALDRTHAASIVHRDLKPENLFLTHRDDGTACIKILDFGISKIMNDAATGRNTTSIGTPAYMAPEQIVGGPVTPAADLHSFGLIAFTLLTGRAYWQDDVESTDNALAFALRAAQGIREGAVSRAARHGHALPPEFDAWFARAVALDLKRRFQSASETVQELADALGVPATMLPSAPSSVLRPGRVGASASTPRAESEHVASTMHGAELGPPHRKPSQLVRRLAFGASAGFVAVALGVFLTSRANEPARPLSPSDGDIPRAASAAALAEPAPVVSPVDEAVATSMANSGVAGPSARAPEPAASAAEPSARLAAKQALAAATAKTAARPAASASLTPSQPAPASSSPPAASATASFPTTSEPPKPKYTRD